MNLSTVLLYLSLHNDDGEHCVTYVFPLNWPVWSLGEGQGPEELEKPIDTPPLSILLIEKPESATVPVGE